MLIRIEVVQYDQSPIRETFWKNFPFHIMSRFWHMTSYSRHFAVFSIFFYLISCFVTLNWFLSNVNQDRSCSVWPEKHFKKMFLFISCPDFDVWCHTAVILPFFSDFFDLIDCFVTLTWFLSNVNQNWSCTVWPKKHFEKNYFSYHVLILT